MSSLKRSKTICRELDKLPENEVKIEEQIRQLKQLDVQERNKDDHGTREQILDAANHPPNSKID